MNSMLRHYQISTQDLADYIRSYDPASRVEPEQWLKTQSTTFEVGSLIFCLDNVAAQTNFGTDKTNNIETVKVKDLCTAVGQENGQALVLNITSGAYELRFIESLLIEKAKKSILAGKPFHYVVARPAKELPDTTVKKIEKLSSIYAQGGSRRNLLSEKKGPEEPLAAFFLALGVELHPAEGKKQLLEIGSICHMIFVHSHDNSTPDKNRILLQEWFKAEPNEPVKSTGIEEEKTSDPDDKKVSDGTAGTNSKHEQPLPKLHWETAAMETLADSDTITGETLVQAPADSFEAASTALDDSGKFPSGTAKTVKAGERATPQTLEEPKLVMTEMSSLMSKLEQQVSKAAKKLASRAEEIERRLNSQLDALLEEANQDDRNIKAPMLVLCESLNQQFQELADKLHNKIVDTAATGRDSIKKLFASNQAQLENDKGISSDTLAKDCQEFRNNAKILSKSSEDKLKTLGQERVKELENMLKETFEQLTNTSDVFEQRLKKRFERFQERMLEETGSVLNALERNAGSMQEEIDSSWERAAEKLASSKTDFELSIEHTLKTAELSISQATRTLLVDQYVPKLSERRDNLASIANEMSSSFSKQSKNQSENQLEGLKTSLDGARTHLQTLSQECLTKLELGGREQQSGLEEVFKESSTHIEANTETVASELEKTEAVISEGESICKKLAETSSLDANPHLTERHTVAWAQVEKLQIQAKNELNHTLETSCTRLENYAQNFQTQLNSFRLDEIQQVRNDCENGLNRIRESIQETLSAIQVAREKFME
jgi:hypothetical protein